MLIRGPAYAQLESAAVKRCAGLFFGSQWAVDEAARLYFDGKATAEQRSHLHEVHLGANWFPDLSPQDLYQTIRSRPKDRIDLLFVGRDWERKGGPLAVEIVQLLRTAGVNATLHIVGCRPSLPAHLSEGDSPAVRIHGPLYRSSPEESAQLHALFLHSHLLIVPTQAECFGIIFAEAQAFGLPPVSRSVHALPSVIVDGVTGLLFPPQAGPQPYAAAISSLLSDWSCYLAMADAAVNRTRDDLSWDHAAESMVRIIFER
jgi:glycosyltransferase involved in cell wall biosynthesis